MRSDDLAPLLARGERPELGFRQGTVLTWNSQTGQNTIEMAGSVLTDVPCMNVTETLTMLPGYVVGLLRVRSQFMVLGRIVIPGTPAFFSGAQPDVSSPMYQSKVDDGLRKFSGSDGIYEIMFIGGFPVHHQFIRVGAYVQTVGDATGAIRFGWAEDITGSPSSIVTIGELTGIPAVTARLPDWNYEWPAGMRGKFVWVTLQVRRDSGSGSGLPPTNHFITARPTHVIGHN